LELNWFDHIVFLLAGIVFPLFSLSAGRMTSEDTEHLNLPPKKYIYLHNALMMVTITLVLVTSWNFTKKPWDLLGFTMPEWSLIAAVCTGFLLVVYMSDLLFTFLNRNKAAEELDDLSSIIPTNWSEYRYFISIAFSAGICEEIIFRGFMISYIMAFLPSISWAPAAAIIIPAISFSISHMYQGWKAVAKIGIIACLFGIIFYKTGSLVPVMIIHTIIDLISGLSFLFLKGKRQIPS